eukprot:CAMPEP_0176039002 /NCGR_PEP_ID=MMETSP0120_2-20121206/19332_1 /TAXON_ID=160619 /ORGANISM="Kryptoperidinium foliaceum, Strain CCMP 1326" /LENGTH=705 /DNA_ID=CAMNT_0017372397 /DNA_START=106 /DNA_END=2223 /DNA_ORIENTATION=+
MATSKTAARSGTPLGSSGSRAPATDGTARQQQQQQQRSLEDPPPGPQRQQSIRDYFRWRPLPWWLCFVGGIFLLTKLQLVYNDSPCAVLGTQSPVTTSDVKRAFRTLSLCTHPDRLRGRLKRPPTPAEERRGEILFNRASAAKDELTKVLKLSKKKEVKCYEGELEMAVVAFFTQVGSALGSLGVYDYLDIAKGVAWNLLTFESGFVHTLLTVLWLAFVYRILKQFLVYLWRMGVIWGSIALVTTVVIGPLPTVLNFLFLPAMRLGAFCKAAVSGPRLSPPEAVSGAEPADDAAARKPEGATEASVAAPAPSTANMAVAQDTPGRGTLQRRKKKESEEEKASRNQDLLTKANEAPTSHLVAEAGGVAEVAFSDAIMPGNIWACVNRYHKDPVKARQAAAAAVQFDILLILTKPVIPLFMLIALGQVWNGLLSSMLIGHALRRWVPQMSYEAHHLLCAFFGMVHTLLGVTSSQVEDYANRDGQKILHLAWSWSFKDVLSVVHMCQLGATVTAMSALGNEPSYAASFASGIAMRIALGQDSIRGLGVMKAAASWVEVQFKELGISLDAADEVVAYSGQGIGDCGGGPFRMLFGDVSQAQIAAIVLKAWLMLIPLTSSLQWVQRAINAGRLLGKRWKTTRFVQRAVLAALGLIQCGMIATSELNASNGALANFWVAMLLGCVGESLLCTYDIRGSVRQLFFTIMFLFI